MMNRLASTWLYLGILGALVAACVDDTLVAEGKTSLNAENDVDMEIDPQLVVTPCWQTLDNIDDLILSGVEVFDDGAPLVASQKGRNYDGGTTGQLNRYTATGEPSGTVVVSGAPDTIRPLADRGAVVGGFISEQPNVHSFYDITRINAAGDTLWSIRFPAHLKDDVTKYAFDVGPDESVVVMGAFAGTIILGEGEENETALDTGVTEGVAAFIAKYSSDGKLEYAKRFDDQFFPRSLVVAPGGTVFATGFHPTNEYFSHKVAAFDALGDLIWLNFDSEAVDIENGGMGRLTESRAFVAQDGSLVIAGTFFDTIVLPDPNGNSVTLFAPIFKTSSGTRTGGASTYFAARYSDNGELIFATNAYDSDPLRNAFGYSYTLLNGEKLLIAGGLSGDVVFGKGEPNETTLSETESPSYIVSYNLNGTLDFAKYLVVPSNLFPMGLAASEDGSLIAVASNEEDESGDLAVMGLCL